MSRTQLMSSSSTSLMTMVGNELTNQQCTNSNTDEATEFSVEMPCPVTVSIPKVEPCFNESFGTSDNSLNTDELFESQISFPKPYKIKDPIILLEKCDKIWETLKLIKNVQGNKSTNTLNSVSLKNTDDKPYVKYQPVVLGDNNATLPHLKLSVKSSRRLHQCTTCGNLYLHKKSLRHHAQVVHGIYISVEKPRHNLPEKANVNKDKESSTVETEQSNLKKLPLKRSHSMQSKDSLSPCVKSHVNKSNPESMSDTQSEGKKINISTHTKETLNSDEGVPKDQGKSISPEELKGNGSPSSSYYQCVLCKNYVKNLRKHLINYHKIVHTDLMLKKLKQTSIVSKVDKSKNSNNNNSLRNSAVTSDKQKFQSNGKRNLNRSHAGHEKRFKVTDTAYRVNNSLPDGKHKCSICSHIYRRARDIRRHVEAHRRHGETKENVNVVSNNITTCINGNSIIIRRYKCLICSETYKPHNIRRHVQGHRGRGETKENFTMKSKENKNSRSVSLRNINGIKNKRQNNSVNLFANKKTNQREARKRTEFYRRNDDKHNTTCTCGRSFRDPYTMHVHKKVCDLESDETGERVSRSRTRMVSNSTSRINITIKKRNDSYEIVGRKTDDEKELQYSVNDSRSSTSSSDNDIETQHACNETVEVSKYSENHSFLKIQDIDEDIDVDIEENSQSVSATNDTIENLATIELDQPLPESFNKQKENKINTNIKRSSSRTSKNILKLQKQNICICGTLFDSRKALDFHVLKHHSCTRFTCGYCNTTFPNASLWKKHQCNSSQTKLFIDTPQELDCKFCNISVNSYIAFDVHIRQKHFDPVVPIQCYQCDKRFSNTTARKIHIRNDHEQYTCNMCDMIYNDNMKNRHEGYHYGLGHPCHICKKTYSSKRNYVRHIQKAHFARRP
ncbi:uncharacterized protein LOC117220539 isoform X1 [Megalopta genalis]|uniref:uncharacterized protein LOC117220539 isoform X1 n=3 Tax=Megalopta genalis TaxID=115081 RepID=UPI003FD110BF